MIRKMSETVSNLDEKIELSDKKVASMQARRQALWKHAVVAKKEGNSLLVLQYCKAIKQLDEDMKAQIKLGDKLNKMKNICEQYLEQKDAIQSITTATELIEEFEVDPMKAEKKMDELRACEDRSNEVNETVMEGVEEDLAANQAVLNEVDESNTVDAKKADVVLEKKETAVDLPSVPTAKDDGDVKKSEPCEEES
ncbi:hypothetical protein WA556_003833 [Blastocystis sp. ATCC 50177/Nand II]